MDRETASITSRIVRTFLTSHLSILFILISVVVGIIALWVTPREEEPQITVPMADVMIMMPGLDPEEVESLAGARLEKLLMEIDGVENVYLMAKQGIGIITVQFFVGQDREDSLVKLYNKLQSSIDHVPGDVSSWVVKPVEVDDVPIVTVTFTSELYNDHELRRIAEEVQYAIQEIPSVGRSYVSGGRSRQVRVEFIPEALYARNLTPLQIANVIRASDINLPAGEQIIANETIFLEAGGFLNSLDEVNNLVVGVFDGRPVYLKDVANVFDGPEEIKSYTWHGFGPARGEEYKDREVGKLTPSVTLAIAKKKGENAVSAAEEIIHLGNKLRSTVIPDGIDVVVTRNYGETANEKVNELVKHLIIAVLTIVVLLAIALGVREALIVALAVPMTLAFTLIGDTLIGYTINRVTLFALILSLGLLVDDPIVDVENIFRHFRLKKYPPLKATLVAVDEVRPPTILATFTVIMSFIPMFFVTGMMGPYMRPMPFNVPMAMLMSLVVAFTVTPWATYHLLKHEYHKKHEPFDIKKSVVYRIYHKTMSWLLKSSHRAWLFMVLIIASLTFSILLVLIGAVPLKMLPFGNKDEFQLVVDMPEGTTLEKTEQVTRELSRYLATVNEVSHFQIYVGTASPFDFNGLVRHYFLRQGNNVADIRVNLADKHHRKQKTHAIALRIRDDLTAIALKHNANLKIIEPPPGPPVLATVVAEIYGPPWVSSEDLHNATKTLEQIFRETEGMADVDSYLESDQKRFSFEVDKEKAMLHGITTQQIAQTIHLSGMGMPLGSVHESGERNPLQIILRLPISYRSDINRVRGLHVSSADGVLVPISELTSVKEDIAHKTIYHKNSHRVQYVTGEVVGLSPYKPIFAMQKASRNHPLLKNFAINWQGEGEWKITLDVF
ncbi:efflux RND transporter permease subunit, partial [bacterium]|nr:efflux RND transporter permease subunit [candidate division CSSED10-310 bacterium]